MSLSLHVRSSNAFSANVDLASVASEESTLNFIIQEILCTSVALDLIEDGRSVWLDILNMHLMLYFTVIVPASATFLAQVPVTVLVA